MIGNLVEKLNCSEFTAASETRKAFPFLIMTTAMRSSPSASGFSISAMEWLKALIDPVAVLSAVERWSSMARADDDSRALS